MICELTLIVYDVSHKSRILDIKTVAGEAEFESIEMSGSGLNAPR